MDALRNSPTGEDLDPPDVYFVEDVQSADAREHRKDGALVFDSSVIDELGGIGAKREYHADQLRAAACSATITLSLQRQLEFPSKKRRRVPPLCAVERSETSKRGAHAAGRRARPGSDVTPPRAVSPVWPPPVGSWQCSVPKSRCDAPGDRSPPPSSSDL